MLHELQRARLPTAAAWAVHALPQVGQLNRSTDPPLAAGRGRRVGVSCIARLKRFGGQWSAAAALGVR
ncbi:hypothetical protein [Botrimarina hoheduenensis]|uniref:hypothetical protein n=1 Tax=Botrimarina hoheduenensis TaxID=2528000 RepID=UPI001E43799A|nr:hypothetical protein [Botrimarina hoheduenensis]